MKYYICIFRDNRNLICNTNSLYEALEFYADNHQMKDQGFLTMLDVVEHKCNDLQNLLLRMNE